MLLHKKNVLRYLKKIVKLYCNDSYISQYSMNRFMPMIEIELQNKHLSQIILPIIQYEIFQNFLIFVSNSQEYLSYNLDFAKTTKHFV